MEFKCLCNSRRDLVSGHIVWGQVIYICKYSSYIFWKIINTYIIIHFKQLIEHLNSLNCVLFWTFIFLQSIPFIRRKRHTWGRKSFPLSAAEVQFTIPPWFPPRESSKLSFFTPWFPHYPFHFSILYVWSTLTTRHPSPTLGCNYSPLWLKQHNLHHLHLLFWVQKENRTLWMLLSLTREGIYSLDSLSYGPPRKITGLPLVTSCLSSKCLWKALRYELQCQYCK